MCSISKYQSFFFFLHQIKSCHIIKEHAVVKNNERQITDMSYLRNLNITSTINKFQVCTYVQVQVYGVANNTKKKKIHRKIIREKKNHCSFL